MISDGMLKSIKVAHVICQPVGSLLNLSSSHTTDISFVKAVNGLIQYGVIFELITTTLKRIISTKQPKVSQKLCEYKLSAMLCHALSQGLVF